MPVIKRWPFVKQLVIQKTSVINWQQYLKQHGFTLPEVMLALSFGSLIMLSAAQTYPLLRQQITVLHHNYRLEQIMRQVMFTIEKDLRRTGFCNGICQGKAMTIANKNGESSNSCVIIAYDLNRNGLWESVNSLESEYFGYRLRQGTLEGLRGVADCQGAGWEKLFDPQEIVITHFSVTQQSGPAKKSLFRLQLTGHWAKRPEIHRQISQVFSGYNL